MPRRVISRRMSRWSSEGCSTIIDSAVPRSEEHTSELQSQSNLVCRLLLEKKKPTRTNNVLLENLFNSKLYCSIEYPNDSFPQLNIFYMAPDRPCYLKLLW